MADTINNKQSILKSKRCALILVLICVGVLIWVSQLAPPIAGIKGILTSTSYINVLEPEIDYSSRNVTRKIVRNNLCVERNITNSSNASQLNNDCPFSYVFNGSFCVPECLAWNPGGLVGFWSYRVTTLLGVLIQLATCAIFLLVWLKADRRVWKFPNIVSFYLMLTLFVQSLAVLAGAILPQKFYCSSKDLNASRMKSTIGCQIQGAVFHYSILAFMMWYLSSFINLTILLSFPLKEFKFTSMRHYFHIIESILCWGLPALLVLGAFFGDSSGNGYTILNAPEFCFPSDEFLLATLYLPGMLFSIVLGTLSLIIIYKLISSHYLSAISIYSNSTSYIPELLYQVLVFLFSFGVMIFIVIVDLIVYINLEQGYLGLLDEYLLCLRDFDNDVSCCKTTYKSFYVSTLSILAGFCTTVYGAPALLAILGRMLKEYCKNLFLKRKWDLTTSNSSDLASTPKTMKSLHYMKSKSINSMVDV